jgi:hypothetical protein
VLGWYLVPGYCIRLHGCSFASYPPATRRAYAGHRACHSGRIVAQYRTPTASTPARVITETRLPAERAAAIRIKLGEIVDELNAPGAEDPDGIPVNVLVSFYSPAEPAGG